MSAWLLLAIISSPRPSSIGLSTTNTHYTSCLLNSREWSQLPSFVMAPRRLTATDDTSFFVLIFENARFAQGSESCFGVLGHSPLPSLGVNTIQEVRCFTDVPGLVGYDLKQIDTEYSQLGASQTVTSVAERIDGQFLFQQSTGSVYDRLDGRHNNAINQIYQSGVLLDTFHTHNTLGSPYGYIGRVYATDPSTVTATTARVVLNISHYNLLFDANISDMDLHTCRSFQRINGEPISLVVTSLTDEAATQEDFLAQSRRGMSTQVRTALRLEGMDAHPRGLNLEQTIWESYSFYVDPPALLEFSSLSPFRTVTAILDLTYPFFAGIQRKVNGVFPSNRFKEMAGCIWVHIVTGVIILYTGVALHLDELARGEVVGNSEGATYGLSWTKLTQSEDDSSWRHSVYYIMGIATVIHSLTIGSVVTKVMGEKRITIPLYFCAGLVNGLNAIRLLHTPRLSNAYLVWGSVNTFIYVRFQILLLCLSYIDWELIYTYAFPAC